MTSSKAPRQRMTQRRIAELAGVSQATVSLVLNGKADAASRIPAATRDRVLELIRETVYVADPAARRLAGVGNKILGVFTYELAFPTASQDFYTPLLMGIEAAAEELGCDLLILTSAPVVDGRRQLLHEKNRLRLADGCLLLGLEMDSDELERLVAEGFPFVAVGRREAAGVPYVGADYVGGTAELVRRAYELGHRRFAYVHLVSSGESVHDRQRGLLEELDRHGDATVLMQPTDGSGLAEDWQAVREAGATVIVVETVKHAYELHARAAADGLRVPDDLSMIVLGDPGGSAGARIDFTRLSPPRTRLAAEATALLARILDPDDDVEPGDLRTVLDCAVIDGATLAAPRQTTSSRERQHR